MNLIDSTRQAIDKKMVTILISFDFTKAFDRISHPKLLRKLRNFGCSNRAIMWLSSSLRNRSQATRHQTGDHERWLDIYSGEPQGSTLAHFFLFALLMICLHTVNILITAFMPTLPRSSFTLLLTTSTTKYSIYFKMPSLFFIGPKTTYWISIPRKQKYWSLATAICWAKWNSTNFLDSLWTISMYHTTPVWKPLAFTSILHLTGINTSIKPVSESTFHHFHWDISANR